MVASPNAVFKTTLAVFLPTPGSRSSFSRDAGTAPACRSMNRRHVAMMFLALLLYNPIDLIYGDRPSTPSASIAAGVFAARNNGVVALFTLLSVAWADSITATKSSNGDR